MKPCRYGPFAYSPIIDRPPLRWPNGANLAVWVVPNIEFFPLDEPISGEALPLPNIFAWSRRDYGNRIGVFRVMDVLSKRNIRATVALYSEVCTEHPRIIERGNELGWEFMAHCQSNARPINKMEPAEEKRVIAATLDTIGSVAGVRPHGWRGSGGNESWGTLDTLAECGVHYVADWINDDQPYLMNAGDRNILSIPYSADINDTSQINRKNITSEFFGRMIRRQCDVLLEEGKTNGRVMCIALHPWIIGQPHRIGDLADALDYMKSKPGVWFATGREIIDAYLEQVRS